MPLAFVSTASPALSPAAALAQLGAGELLFALGGLVAGAVAAYFILRAAGARALTAAKAEADRVLADARNEARRTADQARLDAEKVALERSRSLEADAERQRSEIRDQEKRLAKREDLLDRKLEGLAAKEDQLARATAAAEKKDAALAQKIADAEQVVEKQKKELLRISGMTAAEAREVMLQRVEDDCRHDVAMVTRKIVDEADAQAKEKAREITLMAVQRYAAELTSDSTVRAVPIPSEDMKGRIIGREGRNIRAIERATGVDIIVDDTPGVIVVSCFDKVRQTVAAEALQKLIADGRVHPSRIEEVVAQVRSEVNERILKAGKDAVLETKLKGVNPKVVEAMGKLHFRVSYGQNVLRHSIEVAFLSQMIAEQLGLDGTIARRCGFLHDIGKAMDHEMEGGHPKIGMDFARLHGEKEPVLNAIGGHHADIAATSFYTPIVMAADAVSGARPGARRESLEKYIQRLEQLQGIALEQPGVEEAYAIQAGREVRVMVDARKVTDDEAVLVAKNIADRVSAEMTFPGEIRVTVLRETRAVEFAR